MNLSQSFFASVKKLGGAEAVLDLPGVMGVPVDEHTVAEFVTPSHVRSQLRAHRCFLHKELELLHGETLKSIFEGQELFPKPLVLTQVFTPLIDCISQ